MSKEVEDLNLICIGPLTNLALACRLDPHLPSRIASLTVMGGTYKGIGNITLNTEFNFCQDPEAVSIVLNSGFKNFKLVPWDTCIKTSPTTPEQIAKLYDASTPLGKFHHDTHQFMYNFEKKNMLVDVSTAVITIDESVILESFDAFGVVETSKGMSRGSISYLSDRSLPYQKDLIRETYGIDASKPNVTVITEIDIDKSIEIIARAKELLQ